MQPQTETSFDVRDLLWQARRHRWLIVLPIVACLCGALLFVKVVVPIYQSDIVVSVGERAQLTQGLEALARPDRQGYSSTRDQVSVLDSRIHSRAFLAILVERLNFGSSPAALADAREAVKKWQGVSAEEYAMRSAVTLLGRKILVVPLQGSLVRISVQDPTPLEAQRIANAVAELLAEQSRKFSLERAQARGAFSADQIAVYQERLRRSEDALRAFQESLIGRNISTSAVNDNNLDLARSLIRQNNEEMEQVRARLASEREHWRGLQGGSEPPPELANRSTSGMERRLGELESEYAMALLQAERGASDAATLRGRVGDARQTLLGQYEDLAAAVSPPIPGDLQEIAAAISLDRSILRSLQGKDQRLTQQVSSFTQAVRSSPRDQMELERLRSEVETNRQLLATLQKEVTSSRISEALETSDLGVRLDVVEQAQVPLSPFFPDRRKIFGGALVIGPVIAIGLILAMEKLGATLKTLEQAERELGVPVIGTIPRVEGWRRPGSFLQNNWAPVSIVVVLLLTGVVFTINSIVNASHKRPAAGSVERR